MTLPMKVRNEWFELWVGEQLEEGSKMSKVWMGQRILASEILAGDKWEWASKERLIQFWGKTKTENRIAKNVLERRPDPLTGLEDDENAEFKMYKDCGSNMDRF